MGGVNFAAYGFDPWKAWTTVINTFPPTSLNQLQAGNFAPIQATAPVISGPVYAGSTTVSGTSVEAAGSAVTVFRNGIQIGTATVQANGTWSLTGIAASLLKAADKLTATVAATSKSASGLSNEVTVTAPAVCRATPTATLTGSTTTSGNRYMTGTTGYIGKQKITIYTGTVVSGVHTYTFEGSYIFTSTTGATGLPTTPGGMTNVTGTVTLNKATNYVVTVTPLDAANNPSGCESVRSNQLCYSNGNSAPINSNTPTITRATGTSGLVYTTLSDLPAQLASVSGTIPSAGTGVSVILFVNGNQTTYRSSTFTQTGTAPVVNNWTIDISGLTLSPNDNLNVRAEAASCNTGGLFLSAPSNIATVKETTATPVINEGPYCGNIKTLSGTAEPGSVVTIFTNNVTTNLSATASSAGVWTVDVSSLNGGTGIAPGTPVTARAKSVNKATSLTSTSVSATAAAPVPGGATFTIDPVTEPENNDQLVTLTGTAPASDGTTTYRVTVDINGTVFPPVTTTASGTWELSGISPLEVYAGAVVTATFSTGSGCPSAPITSVVQCRTPSGAFTTTLSSASVCYNSSVTITLSGSERGVSYRITDNGVPTGASVIGTGASITLTSGLLTASTTTLSVRATNVGSSGCVTPGIGGNKSVTVSAAPNQPTSLVASTASGCSQVTTNLTLNGPTVGYTYQLINKNTKVLIGTEVTANSTAALTLATGLKVTATTTYGVLIKTSGGSCSSESTVSATVTVTEGPSLNRAVTIDKPAPCSGETVTISVATQANGGYTYTIRNENGVAIGSSFTGTGGIVSRTTPYGITAATAPNDRTFYVEVSGGCFASPTRLENTVSAAAATAAPAANAGAAQSVCGPVRLDANYASPGVGTWSVVGGTPGGASFSDTNDPKATLTGLPSGTYTLTWTITNSCGGANTTSSSDVQITVNCAAEYLVAAPKYANQYQGGDVLASASDVDGGIQSASLLSGTLPAWAEILPGGNVAVRSGMTPVPGTYSFTMRTTDNFSITTDSPLSFTVYGETPAALVVLPVELLYFTAVPERTSVTLRWRTASEANNDRFIVERSADGHPFTAIGTVRGQGNSQVAVDYSFVDASPITGTTYYRLRQIDLDGTESFSQVVAVAAAGAATTLQLQTYPNPFTTTIAVAVTAPGAKSARLQLVDLQGRVVLARSVVLNKGLNQVEVDVQQLASGMYMLQLTGEGVSAKAKVIKSN
ncbi:T9SS type A sorting domain-containing protein [Lewinella sp. IMCC34183]|uniref:T9SS type A sorting domain-containing protein n=1 Tax=Lewinella sp. IMCC34183 TaxID=2248762 RepID=UPI001300AA07|nr:T9SS type A sorting domain-containing protein [Lewinella sp. IMCC34183]